MKGWRRIDPQPAVVSRDVAVEILYSDCAGLDTRLWNNPGLWWCIRQFDQRPHPHRTGWLVIMWGKREGSWIERVGSPIGASSGPILRGSIGNEWVIRRQLIHRPEIL